ncbi:MAG: hypothetical protein WCH75_01765, partial [Candidatus Binatia bacterium]
LRRSHVAKCDLQGNFHSFPPVFSPAHKIGKRCAIARYTCGLIFSTKLRDALGVEIIIFSGLRKDCVVILIDGDVA